MWTLTLIVIVIVLTIRGIKQSIMNRYLKKQARAFIEAEGLQACELGIYNGKSKDLANYLGIEDAVAYELINSQLRKSHPKPQKTKKYKPLYTRELFESQFPRGEE